MNPERAIEQFKYHTLCDSTGVSDQYDLEACIEAVSALKKMIPMKPVKVKYEKGEGYSYRCPRQCKKHGGYVCVSRWQNYCCSCGQAIDWEGVD